MTRISLCLPDLPHQHARGHGGLEAVLGWVATGPAQIETTLRESPTAGARARVVRRFSQRVMRSGGRTDRASVRHSSRVAFAHAAWAQVRSFPSTPRLLGSPCRAQNLCFRRVRGEASGPFDPKDRESPPVPSHAIRLGHLHLTRGMRPRHRVWPLPRWRAAGTARDRSPFASTPSRAADGCGRARLRM